MINTVKKKDNDSRHNRDAIATACQGLTGQERLLDNAFGVINYSKAIQSGHQERLNVHESDFPGSNPSIGSPRLGRSLARGEV